MADGSKFGVEDPRFSQRREPPAPQPAVKSAAIEWPPEPPKKRRNPLASCFIGCLITAVMLVAVAAVGLWWASNNWRELASSVGSDALKEVVNASNLPADEKDDISLEIDRLADGLREGDISANQLRLIFESIVESPLMTTMVASAIESRYIDNSGLDDNEKNQVRITLRRFIRGVVDGEIEQAGVDDAMQHVARRKRDGSWELRQQVSDEQLRDFLAAAKEQADAAGVPPEPEDIDASDEFKRIIDDAMRLR